MDWQDRLTQLQNQGLTYNQIADKLNAEYRSEHFTGSRVRGWWRRNGRTDIPKQSNFNLVDALRKGVTLDSIADRAGVSERMARAMIDDLQDSGLCIDERGGLYQVSTIPHAEPKTIDCGWSGDRILRFGLLGDTQINSHYTQITHLHTAYDIFQREGIQDVYHGGDLDDGEKMRPGQEYEIYNHGSDAHVCEIVRVYPRREGIKTRYIIGNHDAAYIRLAGIDIGAQVAQARSDMEYLGLNQAYIQLTPNCKLELRHPGDGTAYAQSYKIQKMVEAMSGGEKPNILAVAHYHKQETMFYRNVHCIQTACLQAQTEWMRGKGISAALGFYIVEIHVHDDGQINRIKPEFFPFYKAIKDDWKNWR